jgi:hypothetical protein
MQDYVYVKHAEDVADHEGDVKRWREIFEENCDKGDFPERERRDNADNELPHSAPL